jgi:ferritin-like metal-binding protein YciE
MTKKTTGDRSSSRVPQAFINKLGAMHTAEKELTLALPLMAAAAKSKDLKTLLNIHLRQTKGHVKALDKIAESLDRELPTKACPPIRKLIGQGVKVIGKRIVSSEQDDALIDVGRQIEQFEMSSYEELCDSAEDQGLTHELALLTSVLHQEQVAHELLDDLADGKGPIDTLLQRASLERAGGKG